MELKPCPFCGGKDVKVDAIPSVAQFYRCERCKAKGPYWTAGEDAKEKWNTRATDRLLKEMAEALEEIVRCLSHGLQDCRASVTAKAMLQKYHGQTGELK